jgi:hypothetical protein
MNNTIRGPLIVTALSAILMLCIAFFGSKFCSGATLPRPTQLRRLHLFRPDLIPYPIEYEVYA